MKVYQGRPESLEGREEKERRVYDLLDSLRLRTTEWIMSR